MKREREKHITRLHIILFFLFVITGISIYIGVSVHIDKNVTKYKNLETELVTASKLYYKINQMNVADGYEKRLNIKKIVEQGLVQNDLVDKCKGYVMITSERDIYTEEYEIVHRAYIKCGDKYTTTNYSEY